jgi:hypothetical protein
MEITITSLKPQNQKHWPAIIALALGLTNFFATVWIQITQGSDLTSKEAKRLS